VMGEEWCVNCQEGAGIGARRLPGVKCGLTVQHGSFPRMSCLYDIMHHSLRDKLEGDLSCEQKTV
jgi:hypothetical protein